MIKHLHLHRLQPGELPFIPLEQFEQRTFGVMQVGTVSINTIELPFIPAMGPIAINVEDGVYEGLMNTEVWSEPNVSCVPPGDYALVRRFSPSRDRECWHLVNDTLGIFLDKERARRVSDKARFSCMFHPANYFYDVTGCVGPGEELFDFVGESKGWGVTRSKPATRILENYLADQSAARLTIH